MIFGIGTDIVENSRIASLYNKAPKQFVAKILAESEQEIFNNIFKDAKKIIYLATRWAAKEAIVKAIGTGFRDGFYLPEIAISNNQHGRPEVILSSSAEDNLKKLLLNINKTDRFHLYISLSGERNYATAMAVLETQT